MEIGIFGDSFSYEEVLNKNAIGHPNLDKVGTSWVTLLRNHYDIVNYSVKGCEPFYMYEKFLKHCNKHDKIIFLFPRPGRVSTTFEGREIHIPFVENANNMGDEPVYSAYTNWHKYLFNERKEIHHAQHLKSLIEQLRPDVKFMYGSNWDHPRNADSVIHVSRMENDVWEEEAIGIRRKYIDLRYNHITKENNVVLYKNVLMSLKSDSNIRLNMSDFVVPKREEKECYLIPR